MYPPRNGLLNLGGAGDARIVRPWWRQRRHREGLRGLPLCTGCSSILRWIYIYKEYNRCIYCFSTNIDSPSRYAAAIISKRRLPLSRNFVDFTGRGKYYEKKKSKNTWVGIYEKKSLPPRATTSVSHVLICIRYIKKYYVRARARFVQFVAPAAAADAFLLFYTYRISQHTRKHHA